MGILPVRRLPGWMAQRAPELSGLHKLRGLNRLPMLRKLPALKDPPARAERRGPPSRASRTARVTRPVIAAPLLSVVVPVHNDQDRLNACLDSLLQQTLERIEVIAVDDGSTDHSPSMLTDYSAHDRRVKVLTRPHRGTAEARNAGIAAATAPFITFVDPEDTIPAEAYAYMVQTLQDTGSDFAVGAVRGLKRGRSSRPAWVTDVHRVKRLHITIEDFPDAMHDVIACNRVFRRDFWDAQVGSFATGMAFGDHVSMVSAYVRAASFDLLSATTSTVHIRADPGHLWQQKHQLSNLEGRLAAKELAWQVVSEEASPPVVAAWLGRLLDFDLSLSVEAAVHADDDYRAVVQSAASTFSTRADAATWRHVRVDRSLRLALAAAGAWVHVDRTIEYFRLNGAIPATRVQNGRILADLPFELPVAPERLELSESQASLASCLRKVSWRPDGRLQVDGWAFIRGLDLGDPGGGDPAPRIHAHLVDAASGRRVELGVEPFSSAAITRWSNHSHQRYDSSGFRLVIGVDELVRSDVTKSTRWQLVLQVEAQGMTRSGPVHTLVRSGVGMRMRAGDLASAASTHRVVPLVDDQLGFVVQVRRERLQASVLEHRGGSEVAGRVRVVRPLPAQPAKVLARQSGKTVAKARLHEQPDGSYSFALSLPVKGRPEHWDFRVLDAEGHLHRVSWPYEGDQGPPIGGYGPGTARWRRSPRGFVQLSSRPVVLLADHVTVDEDRIAVDVTLNGHDPGCLLGAVLRSVLLSVPVDTIERRPGGYRLIFPARAALWGYDVTRPLPSGTYHLLAPLSARRSPVTGELRVGGQPRSSGKEVACGVTSSLLEGMPSELRTACHGVTLARKPDTDQLTITLRAPLAEDERGHGAQRRLAQWYGDREFPAKQQVFFQCYRGEFSTDSQRAISEELHRRGAPLDLVWGVHDLSVDLPAGVRPVLMGSRDWYEAIGSSAYLCNNNDFDRFFRRRPHQRFLQTFHGYPFKSMGITFWRAHELSAELIDYECTRRTDAWTSILVPATFCEEIYRSEYLYEGDILVTGYPRNDVLARHRAEEADPAVRASILNRLGVPPGKTVVLYAPTWRDTIATGDWSAKFYDALELDTLADALGEDYVVLLRGHNFNMREGVLKASHAQIVDVTRYPEITDLILAADVAVLDYSSLRFDWVLTGKVVLFFVPDLADYLSARTALFEYGPTAPGPLLSTTQEVIDAVRNHTSVSRDYAQARIEFNERFNSLHDGQATQRVVDAFFGLAAVAPPQACR